MWRGAEERSPPPHTHTHTHTLQTAAAASLASACSRVALGAECATPACAGGSDDGSRLASHQSALADAAGAVCEAALSAVGARMREVAGSGGAQGGADARMRLESAAEQLWMMRLQLALRRASTTQRVQVASSGTPDASSRATQGLSHQRPSTDGPPMAEGTVRALCDRCFAVGALTAGTCTTDRVSIQPPFHAAHFTHHTPYAPSPAHPRVVDRGRSLRRDLRSPGCVCPLLRPCRAARCARHLRPCPCPVGHRRGGCRPAERRYG